MRGRGAGRLAGRGHGAPAAGQPARVQPGGSVRRLCTMQTLCADIELRNKINSTSQWESPGGNIVFNFVQLNVSMKETCKLAVHWKLSRNCLRTSCFAALSNFHMICWFISKYKISSTNYLFSSNQQANSGKQNIYFANFLSSPLWSYTH